MNDRFNTRSQSGWRGQKRPIVILLVVSTLFLFLSLSRCRKIFSGPNGGAETSSVLASAADSPEETVHSGTPGENGAGSGGGEGAEESGSPESGSGENGDQGQTSGGGGQGEDLVPVPVPGPDSGNGGGSGSTTPSRESRRVPLKQVEERDRFVTIVETGERLTGEAFAQYENGRDKFVGQYLDGVKHGVHRSWYSDGTLRHECRFKNGVVDGERKFWDEDGALVWEEVWVEGEKSE